MLPKAGAQEERLVMNGGPTGQGSALPHDHLEGHFSHGGIITGLKKISFMPHCCVRADSGEIGRREKKGDTCAEHSSKGGG